MKYYDFTLAPNPRRVRVFMAEKGIALPETVQVNTREKEQFADWFMQINPAGTVPALVLDDGTVLTESVAICRYFEAQHPSPPLFGKDAREQALVENWNRRAELEVFQRVGDTLRNSLPMFADRGLAGGPGGVPQIPELVTRGRALFARGMAAIDKRLGECRFLAGDSYTVADITLLCAIDTGARCELSIPADCTNAKRWYDEVTARPSAKA
jgi:glutathione S-transferase